MPLECRRSAVNGRVLGPEGVLVVRAAAKIDVLKLGRYG